MCNKKRIKKIHSSKKPKSKIKLNHKIIVLFSGSRRPGYVGELNINKYRTNKHRFVELYFKT